MTTQEKIAKHLGVNVNEPFMVSEWGHNPFHVDPNLGLVTHDGDRVSNALLQEIFFGDVHIIKLDKRKFTIPSRMYQYVDCYLKDELIKECIELEKFSDRSFYDRIIDVAENMAIKHKGDIKYIYQFKDYIDDFLDVATDDSFAGVSYLVDMNRIFLAHSLDKIIINNYLTTIGFNILAKYVQTVGLDTIKTTNEVEHIIEEVTREMDVDDTQQDIINKLIEKVNTNGQVNSNS